MENTKRLGILASIIDTIKSFGDAKSTKQDRENLEDIPASYCENAKVSKKEMDELKKSLAKLDGKPNKESKNKTNKNSELVARYKYESAGGSQRNTVAEGNKQVEKPDDYQIGG